MERKSGCLEHAGMRFKNLLNLSWINIDTIPKHQVAGPPLKYNRTIGRQRAVVTRPIPIAQKRLGRRFGLV